MNLQKAVLGISLLTVSVSYAQKKPLDHSVYDSWKSISNVEVSKSGRFISFLINPQEGDGIFEVKTKDNNILVRVPRATNVKLAKNESYYVGSIKPLFQETRQAKIKKKKADDMPKDSLFIYNTSTKETWKTPDVKSFKMAWQKNDFVAYLTDIKIEAPVDTTKKEKAAKPKTLPALVVRNLATGDTLNFLKADQYTWSPNENFIAFTKKNEAKDTVSNDHGLYLYNLTSKELKKISNGKGTYKELTFDDQSTQLTFLADKSPEKALLKDFKLYYYTPTQDSARVLAQQSTSGVPQNWYVSGDGKLNFSADGQRLYFGLAPIPAVKDTTLVDFEHAQVDIWHWKDDYLQPQQLVNLKNDQTKNYPAVISLQSGNRLLALVDDKFNRSSISETGTNEWMLASSDFGNRIASQWEASTLSDLYLVSTVNGSKKIILKNFAGQAFLNPNGTHVVYFDREKGNWHSYAISTEKSIVLNDGIPVSFVDEENDSPTYASPYGTMGWSEDGNHIYIYDRYDIWRFALNGKDKQLLTNGEGRASKTVYRYIDLTKNDNPRYRTTFIPSKKDIYITSFNENNKYNGISVINAAKTRKPTELTSESYTFKAFNASEDGKTIAFTKENYNSSPDLYVTDNFKKQERFTTINPQQDDYNWGTAELVQWTTPHGYAAEGILYKPENFDPNKKYPIIAYFYEKLTDGLYTYQAPAPTPSRLNIPYFVSNEYLVFAPNISYEIGHPGKSAEEYINSGMRFLAQNSWVDSTKMAIQGQSWGGYQVAHLITRTNMYAAAWTGAPVVNMTSAYGGIRWQTGLSRQFQYERTQSRIGKTLWEAKDLYLENSPLFYMDRVTTPVVIMHNDNDGAVPWYQGIEMFTALRRLEKPVWMLNYNNDEHNLMKRQNRKDIQIRQAQFFDHYLKGKAAPKWITTGVPAIEKGIDWGFQ
ncbi:S9 family peptidase [Sphingobacterium psychroaquaticum]|uniref:Dipeptidyl aminopeptidase/acylaminoacyl peptidase n=1 Tax=Sphingobacterium psychroaquaticum TaxID=561061 RepID=A0A1X7JSG2_9SPHI|nr:prolyl oligopeptidase family serine peptidase [Sphingobacterium psychroaquaticum]SMG31326.1 Dipeptidyl aminopeptidase/acylaminoacyl peptidase [Sphingobacterium psychroaquaticum]